MTERDDETPVDGHDDHGLNGDADAAPDVLESEALVPLGAVLEQIEKRTAEAAHETAEELLRRARTPPAALDAERGVLGALLLEPAAYEVVLDEGLRPEDFYRPQHGVIYRCIQDLHARAEPIDTLTVVDELVKQQKIDQVGGASAISQLEALLPTAAHVGAYARIVREKAQLRMLIETATNIVQSAYRQDRRVVDVLDDAERSILQISEASVRKGIVPMSELVRRATEQLEKAYNQKSAITGVASGFRDLDTKYTSGFQPGELVIVAARPSMGKCLAHDAELVLADGSIATIEQIVRARDADLFTLDASSRFAATKPSAYVDDGVKPVFRTTTRLGRIVDTTLSHPFLTLDGWRPLAELRVGTPVAVPRVLPAFGDVALPIAEVKAIAYALSDPARLAAADRAIVDDAQGSFLACAVLTARADVARATGTDARTAAAPASFDAAALARLDVVAGVVPDRVLRLRRPLLAAFLNRLFAVDGDFPVVAGKARVEWATPHAALAKRVQHLLVRFGVLARRRKVGASWRLEIVDGASLQTFFDEVGAFGRDEEAGKARAVVERPGPRAVRRGDGDVVWDEIASIVPLGDKQVYDLTIPDTHNFVADDVCVHNTAFTLNVASHVAVRLHEPVMFFSLEMGAEQLVQRLIGAEARIDISSLRKGFIQRHEWSKLAEAAGRLSEAPFYIDETPSISVAEMRNKARRQMQQTGLRMIIVDYLQLMRGPEGYDNKATEVAEISKGLKTIARELNIPVIALSQLNRGVESRTDKRPMMSDLRECVVGETLVVLADGRRVPIAELVDTTPQVVALDADRRLVAAASDAVWKVGRRAVVDVHLASGRRVRVTKRHRLFAYDGWRRVADLVVGDRVGLARRLPTPPSTARWPELAVALLGQLVGDGSYLAGQPMRYTTASEDNSDVVARAAREVFGATVKRHAGRGAWHQLVISGNGNRWRPAGLNAWLRGLGVFDQRSHEKRLPGDVFRLPDDQIAALLRHLWATDGTIWTRTKGKGSHRVFFATCSRGLADDVAALLLRLGIVARTSTARQGAHRPVFNVGISGAADMRRFLDVVGAFGPRVAQAEKLRRALADVDANTNVDTLPVEVFADVRARMKATGTSTRATAAARGTAYGGAAHFAFAPSRDVVADYARLLDDDDLRARASDDVFWDRVVAIEDAGEADVYDLTVPGHASWLADGVVSHNSGAIEQDADVIAFLYREEYYLKDKTPEDKLGVAEVIVAKNRNGPTGGVELRFMSNITRFENLDRQHDDYAP